MNKRTAIVFGATGLTGRFLVKDLIERPEYEKIKIFSRQDPGIKSNKIELILDTLESPVNIKDKITGEDLYCCLGTTIKKAGSQKAFEKVDLELPVSIADIAVKNGVKCFAVISSIGANLASKNFYLRTKGRMEDSILKHEFENIIILRPSLLLGPRKEKRPLEIMSTMAMYVFNPLLLGGLRRYRSVHVKRVASAMIKLVLDPEDKSIYESDEIIRITD